METVAKQKRNWKWRSIGEKRELLERYRSSGMSRAEFSRSEGVSESTLRNWLSSENKKEGVDFIPVSIPEREKEWSLELTLSSGTVVRLR